MIFSLLSLSSRFTLTLTLNLTLIFTLTLILGLTLTLSLSLTLTLSLILISEQRRSRTHGYYGDDTDGYRPERVRDQFLWHHALDEGRHTPHEGPDGGAHRQYQ